MSAPSSPSSDGHRSHQEEDHRNQSRRGESMAWAAISTLVAGPAVWGGIGWFADSAFHTERVFTALGVVVGFIAALYLVYVKYGRN